MKCEKCGADLFYITELNCEDCENNGWYNEDEDDFQYDQPPDNEYRNQAEENGECRMGTSFDAGCWMVRCAACGKEFHSPRVSC